MTGTLEDGARTSRKQRIFSVPSGCQFLPTFVSAFLRGALTPGWSAAAAGPLGLADVTIYVPTRRSGRALATTFAEHLKAAGTFLPRILPLGNLDVLETGALLDPLRTGVPDDPHGLAIHPFARRMILTRLILGWARSVRRSGPELGGSGEPSFLVAATPVDAWHLSGELASLLDELTLAGVDHRALASLGSEGYERHWQITLDFLEIATQHWPAILAERGQVDPATRLQQLVSTETDRLARSDNPAPVIVAGAVGADQLTLGLLAAIAGRANGAVVLPGLDQVLDEDSWHLLGDSDGGHGHPQTTLHRVLNAVGVSREDVVAIGAVPASLAARTRFVSQALRPAETTDAWHRWTAALGVGDDDGAMQGIHVIEAAHEGEEALALAIAMRQSLEGDGSAVLVTPDRTLARRVREDLTRWGIEVDDSGGEALGTTAAGSFARLVLDCLTSQFDPVAMLSLLAHPGFRLKHARTAIERLKRDAELMLLRGIVPRGALAEPRALVAAARARMTETVHPGAKRWTAERFDELADLLDEVVAAFAPLQGLIDGAPCQRWVVAHEEVVTALTETDDGGNALPGVDGTRLAALFSDLELHAEPSLGLDLPTYAALFGRITAETLVRGPARSHPRLKILGLLEFRLLHADRVLLGGLDEGLWPPTAKTDAFLNRPMRAALGLAPPEWRMGQAAHDFEMALGQPDVIISRASKRGGAPTVPSRFLQRLAAVAGEPRWKECRARGDVYIEFARALDRPDRQVTIRRPAPKPPIELRPTSLSVTRVETLRRDPYAIYAERILGLRPLEPLGAAMGPREWGTAFHGVLSAFVQKVRHGPVTAEALADLIEDARTAFVPLLDEPHTRAFMTPRLERWVRAFHDWHGARGEELAAIHVETEGSLPITLADGSVFELRAKADRIERHASGAIRLVDYKTGAAPSKKVVAAGFAPQLTLEAAIALGGGFAALDAVTAVDQALYVRFGTGQDLDLTPLQWRDRTLDAVITEHFEGLRDLLNAFRDPATGYVARPFPQFTSRFSDYDHLSRVKEWSATGGLGDASGEDGE